MQLHLRGEARRSESRTPLMPADSRQMIEAGWTVRVEASGKRIFADKRYRDAGCRIVPSGKFVLKHAFGRLPFSDLVKTR
jgi:saccharopine dehydrogenase (NAD+, L-lysine-forming)